MVARKVITLPILKNQAVRILMSVNKPTNVVLTPAQYARTLKAAFYARLVNTIV